MVNHVPVVLVIRYYGSVGGSRLASAIPYPTTTISNWLINAPFVLEAKCGPKEFLPNNDLIEACIASTAPPKTFQGIIDQPEDLYG